MKKVITTIYSLVIGSLSLAASAQDAKEGTEGGTPPAATTPSKAEGGAPAAAKTVKKKITKVKNAAGAAVAEAGEEGGGLTVGGSKQEPKPGKYGAEVSLDFLYSSDSGTSKTDGSDDATKVSGSSMTLNVSYEFIFGHFGVGPVLSYGSATNKNSVGDSNSTTTTSSLTGIGFAAEYFIFDIQTDKMVPFVGFSYLMTSGSDSSKQVINGADGADVKTTNSGNQMNLGAGLKYFLARHVSVDPAIAYSSISSTTKTTDANTKDSKTKIQLVAGLSTYF